MKKIEAKEALAELEARYKNERMKIGFHYPELVYPKLRAEVVKKIKKTAKTKNEIAVMLSRPLTTIAPIVGKLLDDGAIEVVGDKKVSNRIVKLFKAVAPQ